MRFAWGLLLAMSLPAAAEGSDDAALRLADSTPETKADGSPWRSFVEAGVGSSRALTGKRRTTWRLSMDLRYDRAESGWRTVFSSRTDVTRVGQDEQLIHTLREAYLSRTWSSDAMLDMGRINARHGVALGYNPTDYFRGGALRTVTSINPANLRENRQGSVMVRGQWLWDGGSLSALYAPKLGTQRSTDPWSLDTGATNPMHRGMLVFSHKLTEQLSPQWLLYQEQGAPPQMGFNLTGVIGQGTVVYGEWSGGRGRTQLDRALQRQAPEVWRNRVAAGFTHTTAHKVSWTAEWQYNGAAPDARSWDALATMPARYIPYRLWAFNAQELPTRQALLLHASWQDALITRLDLSAMLNLDLVDSSRRTWVEVAYRGDRFDYAFQALRHRGSRWSTYGALPEANAYQFLVRRYF